jgi:uncharacterized membrane protein
MLRQFGIALLTLVILDGLWLGLIMKDFYRRNLSPIARMNGATLDPIWPVAALVYPVLALGITVFVLGRSKTPGEALMYGALFGALTYAVYDLTNHATLREWTTTMTVVDIMWGTVSCAASAWVAMYFARTGSAA